MKNIFILNGKTIKIRSLKTKEELEILQFLFVNPNPTESEIDNVIDDVLRMEDLNPSEFSKTEKLCLLLKIREYTFGNEITIKFKCSKCKKPAESSGSMPSGLVDLIQKQISVAQTVVSGRSQPLPPSAGSGC